jgi:hypothetical protein
VQLRPLQGLSDHTGRDAGFYRGRINLQGKINAANAEWEYPRLLG